MSTAVEQHTEKQIARPLRVLVPLIKEDLAHGERAGIPFYRAAGEKMIEAKSQLKRGEFGPWIKRNFKIGDRQARFYMRLADATNNIQNGNAGSFSSLNDFIRQTSNPDHGRTVHRQAWHEGVKESVERAKREAERIQEETLSRAQEREAEQRLGLRLIEIGFKVLAKELHPDKGGSRDAMARLNRVRDRLKQHA